ncbi:hypothetical protein ACOSQ4_008105 [Xanthoceras sorbifolium]
MNTRPSLRIVTLQKKKKKKVTHCKFETLISASPVAFGRSWHKGSSSHVWISTTTTYKEANMDYCVGFLG